MTTTILALDASSTMIGWCIVYAGTVEAFGEIALKHDDVNHRCRLARAQLAGLIVQYPDIDAVAFEAPASPHKSSLIPQCFVSGAMRAYLAERNILICDVAPQHAKIALAGKGNADKALMQERALAYGVRGEHASDALGVALVAAGRVQVVEVAA